MIGMKRILKRFAAWVTSSRTEPFQTARLKLTVNYIVGMMILLAIFNFGVYSLFVSDIPDAFETSLPASQRQTIDRAGQRLEQVLLLADSLMAVAVSGFGYYFAGRTLRPIELMYARQKKFVADAAHELRTPLAVMKTGTEATLAGQPSNLAYKKLIRETLEEVDHMTATVDDLLFLTQYDGNKKAELNEIDLQILVRKQVELMKPYASVQGVVLEYKHQGQSNIRGNKMYIKRLLINLFQNAIDYNKPGGTVTISLQKSKQGVGLSITDTGIGIAQDDLAHIFDRFYKADGARTRQSGSAGLGLAIVQEIVNTHGGSIDIHSQLGKGTSVAITLPFYS